MDLWSRARVFAEEAAKKSQEISKEAAKLSQELVSETAKKSRELAAEASRKADEIRIQAIRRADQIKTTLATTDLPTIPIPAATAAPSQSDLQRFGVTDELREFVKGITISTFRDFPMQDEPETLEVHTVSNVRQDLNEWQAKHATLVLSTVKEISKLRYELCPRYMKERKFWQIYFILMSNYVAPFEQQYMEELNQKASEQKDNDKKEDSSVIYASKADTNDSKLQSKTSTSLTTEQDLDVFLLGDLGSSDEGPDDGDNGFDVDFDKIENASDLESDADEKKSEQ